MTLLDVLTRNHKTKTKAIESPPTQPKLEHYVPFIRERTWRQAHRDNDIFDGIRGVKSNYKKHPDELGGFAHAIASFIGSIVWAFIGVAQYVLWFFFGGLLCVTMLIRCSTMYTLKGWLANFNGVPQPSRDHVDYWVELWPRGFKAIKDICFTDNPRSSPAFRPPITPREALRETVLAFLFWGGAISMTIVMQFVLQPFVGYVYHYFFG